ncbi:MULTISPECIES: hypothetical protein [unclassified Pseudoalteromonas]|uniref:hypothetical protein n=1 Tax=unclassified Pseudoalteromonas TaxID=194690 RepID=UPI00110BCFBF|nr:MULTISPECIES: hypothetical protein [unclassified Pseudoalteromonas]TMP49544.1 hypothetical protein CWB80_00050 [Pseudoalteromonas sp. S1650]TMP64430.1 hypothetical protein CWB79_20810 [Pseudoalteromonas sp. S1649]
MFNKRVYYKLFSFLLFLQVGMLLVYFSINVKTVGEMGSGLVLVGIYFLISIGVFTYLLRSNRLYVKFDVFILFLLIAWLIFRITVDKQDTSYLKDQIIGTAGGVLFFLTLGWTMSISLSELLKFVERNPKLVRRILLILITMMGFFYIDIFLSLKMRLRDDVFLLSDVNGAYQRPGNFSTIIFIILTSLVFTYNSVCYFYNASAFKRLLVNSIYITIAIIAMLNAQMMGSNNSFLMVGGIAFISLVMQGVIYSSKSKVIYGAGSNIRSLLFNRYFMKKTLFMCIFTFLILSVLSIILISFSDFDFSKTRFSGYGSGNNDSILSRLDIIKNNFLVQFSDSPLFGNYNVDVETTGNGTYPHSALLFSLTHTGVIGFSLAVIFFYRSFRGILIADKKLYSDRISIIEKPISILYFCIIIYVFLIANLATVLLWAVLWFSIGFLTFLIRFKNNESS